MAPPLSVNSTVPLGWIGALTVAVYVSGSPPVAVSSDAASAVEVGAGATVIDAASVLTTGGSSESLTPIVNR